MLKCSDVQAKERKDHADVVYFWTSQEKWWSKKFGDLDQSAKPDSGKPVASAKKSSPRKSKQTSKVAKPSPKKSSR
jgi:DNA topoisomerase-1